MPPNSSSHARDAGNEGPQESEGAGRRATRKQPIVSCLECRRMKWKCDRVFPCSNCRKRGVGTLCPGGQLQPIRAKNGAVVEEIRRLQERIGTLEDVLRTAQQQGFINDDSRPEPLGSTTDLPTRSGDHQEEDDDGEFASGQLVLGAEPGSSTFVGNGGAHYDWRIDLAGDASRSSNHQTSRDRSPLFTAGDSLIFSHTVTNETLHGLYSCLPPRESAARWAEIYFQDAAVLHCTLDKHVFYSHCFEQIYTTTLNPITLKNQELALVFLVLATGAAMDLDLPPYNDTAEHLFRLGRSCLGLDPSDSITLIQAIHLMSRFLSNTFTGPRTTLRFWTTLGTAVRCAQSVGLHRDGSKWHLNHDEIEMRRRVFWEIYTEDVLQSMTQARPRLISDAVIDCRLPIVASHGGEGHINQSKFHHHKYLLVRLLVKVNDVQINVKPFAYKEIHKLHAELKAFEDSVPIELSHDMPLHNVSPRCLQWQILTLRSLNVEGYMFLHRSFFARALRDAPHEPMESSFRFSYVAELEASRQVLIVLHKALSLNASFTSRFLIFFFHAFTAIVNFSAVVIRSPKSTLAAAAFAQAVHGLALFESLPENCRARKDLPLLRDLVSQARLAFDQTEHPSRSQANELDILGIGTKLFRLPVMQASNPASNTEYQTTDNRNQLLESSQTSILDAFLVTQEDPFVGLGDVDTAAEQQQQTTGDLPMDWSEMNYVFPVDEGSAEQTFSLDSERSLHAFLVSIGLSADV